MKYLTSLTAAALLAWCSCAIAGEPILIDFTASWCPPCQRMKPVIGRLEAAGVDVRVVDCSDRSRPNRWAVAYRVTAFPTFVVVRDGRETSRIEGACSEATLRQMLGQRQQEVNYQRAFSEELTYSGGTVPVNFKAGWFDCPPISQSPARLSPTHTDVMQQVPAGKSLRAKYEGAGPTTWAHEECHVVNCELSNHLGPGIRAFYMLDGKGFAMRAPQISKSLVESKVPDTLRRGRGWQLYMTGMNPDSPFVILDEWVAYIASAKVANELYGAADSRQKSSRQLGPGMSETVSEELIDRSAAIEFAGYATVLLQAIERFEPTYPDLEALREFVSVNIERTMEVQTKPVTVAYQQYFRKFCGQPQQQWSAPGAPQVRPIAQQPPVVNVPPRPTAPPCKSCECSGEGACKCDPASACKCDGKDVAALTLKIQQLEMLVIALQKNSTAPLDYDVIAPEIQKRLDPLTFEIWDEGKLIPGGTRKVKLGGTVPLERYLIGGK